MHERRDEQAFTGLEAAVVLIAFVVVAAVFSYVVLNTGFFATQKTQDVVYAAVAQTDSALSPIGGISGVVDPAGNLVMINFSCRLAFGTTPVDFSHVTIVYSNATRLETLSRDPATYNPAGCVANSGTWAVYQKINSPVSSDTQLGQGMQFLITACPSQPPVKDDTIRLEIRPANGIPVEVSRSVGSLSGPAGHLH